MPGHLPVLTVFIALVLILTGMGYKVSFGAISHVGSRRLYRRADSDHYVLAIGSKAAGFALLTRFFFPPFRISPRAVAGPRSRAWIGRNCCSSYALSR